MKVFLSLILVLSLSTTFFAQSVKKRKKVAPPSNAIVYNDENSEIITRSEYIGEVFNQERGFEKFQENGKTILKLKKHFLEDKMMPDFTATDLNGEIISTKELRGKIIFLDFWFVACTGCIQDIPELNRLKKEYENNKEIVFLAISFDEKEQVQTFLKKKPYQFQMISDGQQIIDSFQIKSYPANFIVDKNGMIVYRRSGIDSFERTNYLIQKVIHKDLEKF